MEKLAKRLEKFLDSYIKNLQKKPVGTILKTMLVAWLVSKVIKVIKG